MAPSNSNHIMRVLKSANIRVLGTTGFGMAKSAVVQVFGTLPCPARMKGNHQPDVKPATIRCNTMKTVSMATAT